MNYERIYEYRFKDISLAKKEVLWKSLTKWIKKKYLCDAVSILDPAGGMCEFINHIEVVEKHVIDLNEYFIKKHAKTNVHVIIGDALNVEIKENYYDAIFISNFLEHLNSQDDVFLLLSRLYKSLKNNGKIIIMGPNYKYCYNEYFDFADHKTILSEVSLAELLYAACFKIVEVHPQFLPLSFRSKKGIPISSTLIRIYLQFPIFWKIFGKQFLLIAKK